MANSILPTSASILFSLLVTITKGSWNCRISSLFVIVISNKRLDPLSALVRHFIAFVWIHKIETLNNISQNENSNYSAYPEYTPLVVHLGSHTLTVGTPEAGYQQSPQTSKLKSTKLMFTIKIHRGKLLCFRQISLLK